MSSVNRVIRNTLFLYGKMAITLFISLYTTRLLLASLGITDYGIFNVVGGAISMLGFLHAAMAGATQRFMSYAEGEGNSEKLKIIFNISVVLHFAIAIAVALLLVVAGRFFFAGILNIPADRIHSASLVYHFMVASTVATMMTVPYEAVLNAHENMLYFSVVGIAEALLKLGTAFLVMHTSDDKLVIYGGAMACISFLVMLSMRIYTHAKYDECVFAPMCFWDKKLMKEMSNFAGWNLIGTASGMISGYGSGIILNHFFGTVLNAANGITGQINGQMLALSNTMQRALAPMITKDEGRGQRESVIKSALTGSKLSFLMYVFFSIPLLIETPWILGKWLTTVPDWTVVFLRLSIFRVLIEQLTSSFGVAISAVGNIKGVNSYKSFVSIAELALLGIIFSLGMPPFWFVVIGIVSAFVGCCIVLTQMIKCCGLELNRFFKEMVMRLFAVCLGIFLIALIPHCLFPASYLRLGFTCLFSSAAYLVLVYSLALNMEEKNFAKGYAVSLYKKSCAVFG